MERREPLSVGPVPERSPRPTSTGSIRRPVVRRLGLDFEEPVRGDAPDTPADHVLTDDGSSGGRPGSAGGGTSRK